MIGPGSSSKVMEEEFIKQVFGYVTVGVLIIVIAIACLYKVTALLILLGLFFGATGILALIGVYQSYNDQKAFTKLVFSKEPPSDVEIIKNRKIFNINTLMFTVPVCLFVFFTSNIALGLIMSASYFINYKLYNRVCDTILLTRGLN